jgi:eukaryotic-like serine/threonine-protein kinase
VNIATPLTAVNGLADSSLVDLVDEIIRRVQAGEAIDPDALAGDDAQRAEQIRQLLPTVEKLADLGGSATSDLTGAPSPATDASPGLDVLGDYHLLREVGRGGMGIVYEAQQVSLHRRVALKVLPFAAVTDPKQLQRFHIEAQAAAQLHHTNIVPVFAVGCERGVHYYVMQFIEGETLARVIEELQQIEGQEAARESPAKDMALALASGLASGGTDPTESGPEAGEPTASCAAECTPSPAPPAPAPTPAPSSGGSTRSRAFFQNAARLGIQAAEALEHAHQQGVLHRDIKPSNLLLDAQGNLWVTDFGLARLQSEASLTLTGDILGTLRYMSPEQALAKRVVIDHRTDVYSLGATLYELMTLHAVFEGDDRQELLRSIAFAEPRPPRKLNPSIPRELETIILKALAKDPASRFGSAQELADDLRRFLEHRPIMARRPTVADRAAKWARRHPAVVWSSLVILALSVVGLSAGLIRLNDEKKRTEQEKENVARVAESLRRQDYVNRINIALREIQDDGNVALAERLLDGCPTDLRDWEWNYVTRQAHLDILTFRGHLEGGSATVNRPDGPLKGAAAAAWPASCVECVAISPKGRWAASGTGRPYDNAQETDTAEIRLWDVDTRRERPPIEGLVGAVQAVAFSPDGTSLDAAGGSQAPRRGGWVRLWDAATGKPRPLPIADVSGMTGMAIAFSPDSKWLAVGYGSYMGPPPGRLTLVNVDTGEEWSPERKPDFGITSLAFCPGRDRPLLAAAGMGGVEIWDWKTRTPAGTLASDLLRPGFKGVPGHYGSAICVAFSGDGPTTASGGWDQTIKLWEPQSGKVPQTLYGQKGYVLGAAFSPNGKRLASVGEDRVVRLREVATGREEAVFRGHNGHVFAVAFHPDGRRVFSGGFDGLVKVWDLRRSRPVILDPRGPWVNGVAFSRDGRLVATETDGARRVWDPDTGEDPTCRRRRPRPGVRAILQIRGVSHDQPGRPARGAYRRGRGNERRPDRRRGQRPRPLLAGRAHDDGHVRRVQRRRPADRHHQPRPYGQALGRRDRAGGPDPAGSYRRRQLRGLQPRRPAPRLRQYRPDSPGLGRDAHGFEDASRRSRGSEPQRQPMKSDGGIMLPRSASSRAGPVTPAQDRARPEPGHSVRVTLRPRGLMILWTGLVLVAISLVPSPEPQESESPAHAILREHTGQVNAVAFAPDCRTLASGGEDEIVVLWDVTTSMGPSRILEHKAPIHALAFAPDGRTLAAGGLDANVRLWDVATGEERIALKGHTGAVRALAFAPDGHSLASAGWDGIIRFWHPGTGRVRFTLSGHTGGVNALAFAPDGRTLASGATDSTLRLWDVAAGRERVSLRRRTEDVFSLAFSPDGLTLASGSLNGGVTLWDAATGQPRAVLPKGPGCITALAFAPDGRTLAWNRPTACLTLWDVERSRAWATLRGHSGPIRSVASAPDGRHLASCGADATLRLWDLPNGTVNR